MKPNAWVKMLVWTMLVLLAGGLPVAANSAPATSGDARPVSAWTTVAASGSVQARLAIDAEAAWRDVSRGDELLSETHVKTGRRGRTTLTRSSSLLMVAPYSEVELPADGYSEMQTSVIQTSGSVLYKIDGRANPHFEVVTPYLVAGVKGTSFLVTVNERYASVTVQEGLVQISNPDTGEVFDLRPGESAIRHRDDPVMELVYDRRRSKDARREHRKLDRMDRDWGDAHDGRSLDQLANDRGSEHREKSDALFEVDAFGSAGHGEIVNSDELANELREEMIGEGVHDGSLKEPDSFGNFENNSDNNSENPPPGIN